MMTASEQKLVRVQLQLAETQQKIADSMLAEQEAKTSKAEQELVIIKQGIADQPEVNALLLEEAQEKVRKARIEADTADMMQRYTAEYIRANPNPLSLS